MRFTIKPVKGANGKRSWMLEYRLHGVRQRPRFKTKEFAEAEKDRIQQQVSDGGTAWLGLKAHERTELMSVYRDVKSAGKNIRQVWEDYKRLSKGKEVVETKIGDAFKKFIAEQEQQRLSKRSLAALKSNVGRFVKPRASMFVSSIVREEVANYLKPFTGTTFNSYRTSVNTFFIWCVGLKYTAENPVSTIDAIKLKRLDEATPPAVLHYNECLALFKATLEIDPGMVRYTALCLQAGLRPEREAKEVRPGEIKDYIHVRARWAKDRQERYIEITPALKEWLALPLDDEEGPHPALKFQGPGLGDWPIKNLRRRFDAIRIKAGVVRREGKELVGWDQDCMRHTFASAYYAVHGAAKTIEALGHDDYDMLYGHYRMPMTKEEGQKIMSITPAVVMAALQQSE